MDKPIGKLNQCKDCKWWETDGAEIGFCHRYPSVPIWNPKLKKFQGACPNTKSNNYCGEFALKEGQLK